MVAGVRQLWMAKPSGSKNGRGIKVLADPLADAPRKEGILIQRYVHPPYLVGGLKVSRFLAWIGAACLRERVHGASITRRAVPWGGGLQSSMRLYVVCTDLDPLRLYVYDEAMVYFSGVPFNASADPHALAGQLRPFGGRVD
jgi:hypothetical protein